MERFQLWIVVATRLRQILIGIWFRGTLATQQLLVQRCTIVEVSYLEVTSGLHQKAAPVTVDPCLGISTE